MVLAHLGIFWHISLILRFICYNFVMENDKIFILRLLLAVFEVMARIRHAYPAHTPCVQHAYGAHSSLLLAACYNILICIFLRQIYPPIYCTISYIIVLIGKGGNNRTGGGGIGNNVQPSGY